MAREVSTISLPHGPTLSYAAQGEQSAVPLVLLPGPTDSWLSYAAVLDQLPSWIRAVAVSQRGHGDSDKPASGYRVEDFAHDAVLLLDALGIERAVLIAHSGSCLVARRVAIEQPERVAGLVLEASPSTLLGDAGLNDFVESVVSTLQDPIDGAFARSFVADTSSPDVSSDLSDELVRELLKVPARVWRELFASLLHYDDRSELARITAPTLLIWGAADVLVRREMQEELIRQIPSARLEVYSAAGHTPRWEDPSRFASDVAKFVDQLLHPDPEES
ncbi:MAG: alpha/beta hydrolase [Actinobacteria bacterium]|nr:alpha/beta hydrolase [Actinomycetota bacterium]